MSNPPVGAVMWRDLTVDNADQVASFYERVVGWRREDVDMGGYADYAMKPAEGDEPVAGVCHARGVNENLPPQWLVYVRVADLEESLETTTQQGGQVVATPRGMGGKSRMAVIKDPAGAVLALFESGE